MTRFGPVREDDAVRFRLWAPNAEEVALLRANAPPEAMERNGKGFFSILVDAETSQLYRFRVDGLDVPDPASCGQSGDVDDWSRLVGPLGAPRSRAIRPWHEAIIAELHVGTATPDGTFAALIDKLPYYVDSGYTALELMPVADFVGRWNWGYDGVLLYAPDTSYGTPEDLRALVDAAHDAGLAMLLDVVYNHFGPAGNYLRHYAAAFFTDKVQTPWGAAIDLANPIVRSFFAENAAMWLGDYDFDGLRFDAVHAFAAEGGDTLLAELATACRRVKPDAWLVLENDDNAARWLDRDDDQPRHYTAQWNDDIHHAFHVTATGQRSGYYADYAEDPVAALARCLAEGFAYQGEPSRHRDGTPRGEPSAHLPPEAFVAFVQNHDQVGNRPFGDRLAASVDSRRLELIHFVLMLAPQIPLFFMGEEAAVATPFPFFCDFGGELADAVRQGRAREFAGFFADHAGSVDDLPDALAASTFESAKLPWDRLTSGPGDEHRARFAALARLRRARVWPLTRSAHRRTEGERTGDALLVTWTFDAGTLVLAANLGDAEARFDTDLGAPAASVGRVATGGAVTLGPWSAAAWSIRA